MSEQSQGPGWWQASDGKWYAPELHPDFFHPAQVSGPPGITAPLPPVANQMAPAVTQAPPLPAQTPDEMVIGPSRPSSSNVPRRWWVWAVPVIAAGLALAIVLPLTMGGTSKTNSTSTPPTTAAAKGLTGSYVANAPPGPQPLLLTLVQSGSSLAGTFTGVVTTTKPPLRVNIQTAKVTGTVKGKTFTLGTPFEGQQQSITGSFSGTSLTLDVGQGVSVVFKRGTLAQFDSLVAHDRNGLLAQAALVASRAAESNLTNAITEGLALYQVTQAYASTDGQPYGARDFSAQAPEFTWTTGSCGAASADCISFQVVDVVSEHDAQGIAMASYSPESSTCWYAVDLEAAPTVVNGDAAAFDSSSGSANVGVRTAGVVYARSPVGSSRTSCTASLVLHAHHAAWAGGYSTAGGLS